MREFQLYALPEIDQEAMDYLAAHETSEALSRALTAGGTYHELAAALESEYAGQPERAAADIDTFLAALRARGLTGH